MSGSAPLPVRVYRALTALLPGELGDRYAEEATTVFGELYREAVRDRGLLAGLMLWARSTVALIACAAKERRALGRTKMGGGGGPMSALVYEMRLAFRTLVKRRAFSVAVVLILAAGIGATTTIYSVVDTVVLRPLPYPDADRLMHLDNGDHSYPSLRAWLDMSSFESVAAARDAEVDLTQEGQPERVVGQAVSPHFFDMFGGRAVVGRLFGPADYPGDRSVVVLGYGFWLRRWGGDPGVTGRTLRLDGAPTEVIGVLDPAFRLPERATGRDQVDVWFALDDGGAEADAHGLHVLNVVGRLRPGISREAAQAEVDAQRRAVAAEFPRFYQRLDGTLSTTPLTPLKEATVGSASGLLFTLLGAVGLLLLIACANVANLFLARGTSRGREVALRGALGASRMRIGAGVLLESIMLSLAGGLVGVLLSYGGVTLFLRFKPEGIPRIDTLAVDLRVLVFAAGIATLTGVIFGALPALQAMRTAPGETLKEGASSISASRHGRRLRSALVVSEIALAAILVTGAGLLMRSLVAQVLVDPGFEPDGLVAVTVNLDAGYDGDTRLRFSHDVVDRIAALPGTRSVAAGWQSPLRRTGQGRCCWRTNVVGDPSLADDANPFLGITHPVTSRYFQTLGATVAFGRELAPTDEGALVAVLNRPAAQHLFGSDDVVGRTITLGGQDVQTLDVVGVVDGVDEFGATEGVEEAVYVPYGRFGGSYSGLDVIVRSNMAAGALKAALQEAVWALDPDLPIVDVATMDERMTRSVATPRFLSGLVGGFAALALLLASGGVYGTMLYNVSQRRREMGIRLALGAAGRDVVRLVLGHGIRLAVVGIVLGSLGAAAASDLMEQLLWGVEPTDPVTIASVALLLGSVAVGASFIPARRAARTDPVEALKAE